MLESVLVKKYLMVLYNNIIHSNLENSMQIETNAHCIKHLLIKCNDKKFYDVVYHKFNIMKNDKKYKPKFRFILMDISDEYNKKYIKL